MEEIKPQAVKSVYFGKANRCYCGCSGNHHEASNKQMVGKAIKRINTAIKHGAAAGLYGDDFEYCSLYVSVTINGRLTIVYFE